jgi:hypothetical protein
MKYTAATKQVFFGTNKETNERIYLTLPTWDCGWYWSFGYLGNRNCHYHLEAYQNKDRFFKLEEGKGFVSLTEKRNLSMYDCLLADYDLNPVIKENLWDFCDLALSAYALKEAAEIVGRGGAHMSSNPPAKDQILDQEMAAKINNEKLPAIFQALEKILLTEK